MASPMGYFTDEKSIRTVTRIRILYFFLSVIAFFLTEFGRHVYRSFIYSNRSNDFGPADSTGNLGGILVQIFFGLTVFNSPYKKAVRLIAFFCFGYILYEIVQPVLPKGVFDWKDISGTLIGSAAGLLIVRLIHRFYPDKVLFQFGGKYKEQEGDE